MTGKVGFFTERRCALEKVPPANVCGCTQKEKPRKMGVRKVVYQGRVKLRIGQAKQKVERLQGSSLQSWPGNCINVAQIPLPEVAFLQEQKFYLPGFYRDK